MPEIATDDFLTLLVRIRDTFPEAPLPLAIMLLAVARNEGASHQEIGPVFGTGRQYYRHLQRLGSGDHTGPGLNLIAALPHEDGRTAALYLTKEGRRVVHELWGVAAAVGTTSSV